MLRLLVSSLNQLQFGLQDKMKTWQFWVIILVVVFVIVPLVYFAVIAKNVAIVASSPVIPEIIQGGARPLTVIN